MAYGNLKNLVAAGTQIATSTSTELYAAPTSKAAEVCMIIVHNTNISAETVRIFLGGTTDAHRIFSELVAAGGTLEFSPKVPLVIAADGTPTGKGIFATTTTASKVNLRVIGREEA